MGKFLFYYLRSGPFIDYVEVAMTGMAYPANDTKLQMEVAPVPPVAEQHRIVAKVGQLMKLCDELGTKLSASETEAEKLVVAVVQSLIVD